MPSSGRSAGTESEIPWIPRCSDVVELGWGVGQWLGSQILGGVDIVNIKIHQFSQDSVSHPLISLSISGCLHYPSLSLSLSLCIALLLAWFLLDLYKR